MVRGSRAKSLALLFSVVATTSVVFAQTQALREPDWKKLDPETLQHFQSLLRLDTTNPPGNETRAVEYLSRVLTAEGIPFQTFALEPSRANLVARLKGNGRKRPILMMGHTDTVTVEPAKWTFPPFSATRDGGYIYGRGSLDDRPHVVAGLMTMIMLKRLNVPLDRDVIFLAESGEEGTTRVGIDFMVDQHFDAIDAEYCVAENAFIQRNEGRIQLAQVATTEKVPRMVELVAHGPSGHASVPLTGNAVARLSRAIAAVTAWQTPVRLNPTTREYFTRVAALAAPDEAARIRTLLNGTPAQIEEVIQYWAEHTPMYASMLRTSISPTIVNGGLRVNVIPSDATATLDIRMLPDENPDQFFAELKRVINDPQVDVKPVEFDGKPRPLGISTIDSDGFRAIQTAVAQNYDTVVVPTMANGASDNAELRAKGIQCYGIGTVRDLEDGLKGFASHGDQERIVETELYRFVRFNWDVVTSLARAR
jgi:acetylornithine deacetylase/succinyl-diaminopimelate desuccinylase-like protein